MDNAILLCVIVRQRADTFRFCWHPELVTQTYSDLAGLARLCAKQAHFASCRDVAVEFWRMALEYQLKAAALGQVPDIGSPPVWFKE
jgi:hypothetical protein